MSVINLGRICTKQKQLPEDFIRPDAPPRCTWDDEQKKKCENPHTDRSNVELPKIFPNILYAVGNTPLVKLNRIPQAEGIKCDMYVKCEYLNPGGSVKDRIGYRMVQDAEHEGRLKPGCTIIEPSSGNTGIGIAMACAVRGYKCIVVMPEKMSNEKVDTLRVLGAKIIRTPTEASFDSPEGLIAVSQCIQKAIPDSVILDQYRNASNPLAHYDGTAEEILRQCDNDVDMIVCGAGTGGTVSGIGRKIKEKCPKCKVIAADPEGSILAYPGSLNKSDTSFYEVEGIGYDFLPSVLDRSVVDEWMKCNDKEAFPYSRRLISEEGLLSGASSGTALAVALRAAKNLEAGQKCVIILPDSIRNYMTKFISDNWMEARGFKEVVNEHEHKWWDNKASELQDLETTAALNKNKTCFEALTLMNENKWNVLRIIDDDKSFYGIVTLANLTTKVVSLNLNLSLPVTEANFKQFRMITNDTNLGLLSRILEKDEFAVLFDDTKSTIVTRMDLFNFITKQEDLSKKFSSIGLTNKATTSNVVSNGSSEASGTNENLNDTENGQY